VGVILDGHASGKGDPSRGSRFNSAIRYYETQGGDCLVIIVSEDGMINLLPNLRRQVARGSVEAVVRQLEEALTSDPDYEVFFRHWEHLQSLAFYLTSAECERINTARARLEEHRAQPDTEDRNSGEGLVGRATRVGWTPFAPDPDMNSSYFLAVE
jgi:DisA bacterial checkpoint controller nucleotide-binding